VYNLVGTEDTSVLDIASTVQSLVGDVEIEHVDGRGADFRGVEVDGSRAERELGWTAETPFREGVRRYIAWHREEEAAAAASRRRLVPLTRGSLANTARAGAALAMAAVVGISAAGFTSVNSLDDPTDRAALVMLSVLLMLPLALVAKIDWEHGRQRGLAKVVALAVAAASGAVLFPSPAAVVRQLHAHEIITLVMTTAIVSIIVLARRLADPNRESAPDSAA
jgi:hypothetical protein